MNPAVGKYIILTGLAITLIGVIIYFFGSKLGFIGRLPGDIRIEGEKGGFYFPIVTCIVLSIVLTVIVRVVQWLMQR
jgi:hypothetical protein